MRPSFKFAYFSLSGILVTAVVPMKDSLGWSASHAALSAETVLSKPHLLSSNLGEGPVLFFSDLNGGPNTGNTDTSLHQAAGHDGAIVTIWGAGLGESQGSSQVLCNGAPAARIYFWGPANLDNYDKVVFQVDRNAVTGAGKVIVTVRGLSSNPLPFVVRPGRIYFVATSGKDSNSGAYSSPWKTLLKARNAMQAGDVTYAMNGVRQTSDDGEGWDAALLLRGPWCSSEGSPRALVAYPGAEVIVGNPNVNRPASGLRTTDFSGHPCAGNWLFSGLTFRGIAPVSLSGPSAHWRFVGNDISCPNAGGNDGGACFHTSLATDVKFYGNVVHDAGARDASALFHGVYFSTDSNHIDMGWNTVYNVHGCRGVQVHSSPLGSSYPESGFNMYDVTIHDNIIHDTQCDGIVLDTIDPSKGHVSVFNNVIYNAGEGPNNAEQTGSWSCINVRGATEKGAQGRGTVEIDNNTLYGCGTFAHPPYGNANTGIIAGGSDGLSISLRNNIIFQLPTTLFPDGVPYLVIWNTKDPNHPSVCAPRDNCPRVFGRNNLFFGSGPMTTNLSNITGSLGVDPQFINAFSHDFHLKAGSSAATRGVATTRAKDHDGVSVSPQTAYFVGAYASGPDH